MLYIRAEKVLMFLVLPERQLHSLSAVQVHQLFHIIISSHIQTATSSHTICLFGESIAKSMRRELFIIVCTRPSLSFPHAQKSPRGSNPPENFTGFAEGLPLLKIAHMPPSTQLPLIIFLAMARKAERCFVLLAVRSFFGGWIKQRSSVAAMVRK